MIITYTTYGILLTDEFGAPLRGISHKELQELQQKAYDEIPGLVCCPSAEELQIVLGFYTSINKETDLRALEAIWQEEMQKAPEDIRSLAYRLRSSGFSHLDTDIHFLAGHC